MLIFDLFSGTNSATQPFIDAGHTVISFEIDGNFVATEHVNILNLTKPYLFLKYGRPDFIWASPPCTAFSVASMVHHWANGGKHPTPKTEEAEEAQKMVQHTLKLIADLNPSLGWLMENPRGMLRKLDIVAGIPRRTVTYCQYGEDRMKPTDLWGVVQGWTPKEPCKNGMPCHIASPRGAQTGTQALVGAKERSRVPYALGQEILTALERIK
jgi:hypothetical protein